MRDEATLAIPVVTKEEFASEPGAEEGEWNDERVPRSLWAPDPRSPLHESCVPPPLTTH